jgi:hypothetical protein
VLCPGEPDLPVQLDDRPADLLGSLSTHVQDAVGRRGRQLVDARRHGVDELKPVALAEQVELVAVDELLDRVVRGQAGGPIDVLRDPAASAANESCDLVRVGYRRDLLVVDVLCGGCPGV